MKALLRFSTALTAAVVLTAPLPSPAADNPDLAALRDQVRALEQQLKILARQIEIKDEAAAAAPKPPTTTAAAGGFGLTSADKAFDVKFKGLAQFDARSYFDNGAPNRNAFLLRRIRTILSGTVAGSYDFNITPELGGGTNSTTTVALWDAFVAARFTPQLGLRAGKFPSAVGLEPGNNRHFIESPFVNTLLPNRDIGAEFFGTVGLVDYRLGLVNGAANNTTNFGGTAADYADGDKTVVGRVTVAPFKSSDGPLSALSIGLGASRGNEVGVAGTNLSNGLSNISSNGQQAIFSYGTVLFANGRHTRISPSLEWYGDSPWSFAAEYAVEKQDIAVNAAGLTRGFKNSAWRANVGWVITGENATKAGVNPTANFDVATGALGAFEAVVRLSGLDLDDKLFVPVALGGAGLSSLTNATKAVSYGAGLNWYLNRNVRFLFNLEQTEYDGAKTPAAQVGARADELAFTTRIHLSF